MEHRVKFKKEEIIGMIIVCDSYIKSVEKQENSPELETVKSILYSCKSKLQTAESNFKKRKLFNLI